MPGIARFRSTVLDCPDARGLARFYSELLGWPITQDDDGWVVISDGGSPMRVAFQQIADYRPPTWPEIERPQQFHIDVTVDDLDAAEKRVLALGARKHEFQPSKEGDFRVFLDPAGHPFCLCVDL
ncbi:VOC family protein [Thermoactinospora rubra]|uniref:VOC family protein n=1 Tax=Thermoactinospora rubra TaxID=1088767 RepID=UPI000A114F00|nr:VOC family protein [Thermoactinospora rubra]